MVVESTWNVELVDRYRSGGNRRSCSWLYRVRVDSCTIAVCM